MPRRPPSDGRVVGLLTPYWDYFEPIVPFDLRADRAALAAEIGQRLDAAGFEVFDAGLVDSRASGAGAGALLAARRPAVVVVVQALCVPPAYALAALDQLDSVPLVVVAASRDRRLDLDLDHAGITAEGATVGTPQLTNVLHRRGRAHTLAVTAVGRSDEERAMVAAVTAAASGGVRSVAPVAEPPAPAADPEEVRAAVARIQAARILRVGRPIDGYASVECDPDELRRATGIELVEVDPAALRERYLAVGEAETRTLGAEVEAGFEPSPDLAPEELRRTLKLAAALQRLDRDLEADAGAINCHVPEIELAGDPGITPCFALGRETSAGIPWTCSGDAVTAVAMLTLKAIGASALYHEIETLDRGRGEALLANSGEHDLGLAAADRKPSLVPNGWWRRSGRCGGCACFTLAAGPATLLAFTPHAGEPSGFRFVVAEGCFAERAMPSTGSPHAGFRFAAGDGLLASWARWVEAGVNHHSAATRGHHAKTLRAIAAGLGVGCVVV